MSAIVKLDRVKAVYSGNIESVQYALDMENGSFITLGALVSGSSELYTAATPATATLTTEEVLLVASPEVIYTPGATLKDFTNLAGKPARAFHLSVGDHITITNDGFDGTSVVGKYLIPQNNSAKGVIADDLSGATRLALKVIEKGSFGYSGTGSSKKASTTFRVVKS